MKSIYFINVIIFLSTGFSEAQNPNWLWAKSAGGSQDDIPQNICADQNGNIYMTGYFHSTIITFGNFTLNNYVSIHSSDIFLVKYDANGNVVWAKSAGGTWDDQGTMCSVDTNGNVYLIGNFSSDTLILGADTLRSKAMFLSKFDSSGNVIWAKTSDLGSRNMIFGISNDNFGNIFITGVFNDTLLFNGHLLTGSFEDIFIIKLDSNGNVLWMRSAGGTNNQEDGLACATDKYGNLFVTGVYSNHNMYIGSDTLTNFNSTPCYDTVYCPDIFLAKYDSAGNFLWAKSVGGNDFDAAFGIATDTAGSVFIAGYFSSSSITFGSSTFYNPHQTNEYSFVAKFDSYGNVLWADAPNATGANECKSVAADENGNIYITGYYSLPITFGSISLQGSFSSDSYVVKYDTSGNVEWAKNFGNPNNKEESYSIDVDVYSNVYVSGIYNDTLLSFGNNSISGMGMNDIFLAKLEGIATGIGEVIIHGDLNIFPNPTNGNINVESFETMDEIKITDVLGQILYEVKPKEKYFKIFIPNSGIYFISVKTGNHSTSKKIIVNK